jgi:hypothetical protein
MSETQYNELKENGTVTDNGNTIEDIEHALNLTPDTTDSKISALNDEIAELKDQLASVGKVYLHRAEFEYNDVTYGNVLVIYMFYSTRSAPYTNAYECAEAGGFVGTVNLLAPCVYRSYDYVFRNAMLIRYGTADPNNDGDMYIMVSGDNEPTIFSGLTNFTDSVTEI